MALRRKRRARKQAEMQKKMSAPDKRMIFDEEQKKKILENQGLMADFGESQITDELKEQNDTTAKNPPIDELAIRNAEEILNKYRAGKTQLDDRIVKNEDYWKLRQWNHYDESKNSQSIATAWLWNCIVSKHADCMDGFPEANIRPKRKDDEVEAKKLSSIIPVVTEENDYENTYSSLCYYLLKQGTNCAGVFWDGAKHDGLGDINIKKIDLLELFWEPGISDIQDSSNVFYTKLENNELLTSVYPQLEGKLGGKKMTVKEYNTDDTVDTSEKSTVVDWYYKKTTNEGKTILHYCKFVEGVVLFATENDPERYPNGWYNHGMYPFVVTPLYAVEGDITGYGYTDIGRGDQHAIDNLTSSILLNAKANATPRFFTKVSNSGVNEEEFCDLSKPIVHVDGSLEETHVRRIEPVGLSADVVNMRDRFIDEMKETLGNRDVNNGGTTSGITAASAIAAMQEQSGKLSRTHNKTLYTMHKKIIYLVIELIRQFYDIQREFRITGEMGQDEYIEYDNRGLKPQKQPNMLGIDLGLRLPCFDIEVSAQKASPYSKMEQNELAIQLYNLGVFAPQNADMSLALLKAMDFSHKEEIIGLVNTNGTMLQKYQKLQEVAFRLAQDVDARYGTNMSEMLAQAILAEQGQNSAPRQTEQGGNLQEVNSDGTISPEEHPYVERARAEAQNSTQVRE